jgi:hypothetical protein
MTLLPALLAGRNKCPSAFRDRGTGKKSWEALNSLNSLESEIGSAQGSSWMAADVITSVISVWPAPGSTRY